MPEAGIKAHKTSVPSLLNILGNPVQIRVTVETAARDGGKSGAATASAKLQPGLVLTKLDNGKYSDYDNTASSTGADDIFNSAILLDFIDVTNGDQDANVAVSGGVFDREQLRWGSAAAKGAFKWEDTVLDAR